MPIRSSVLLYLFLVVRLVCPTAPTSFILPFLSAITRHQSSNAVASIIVTAIIVAVCNKDEVCCNSGFGCEYSSSPHCCPAGSTCCSTSRHSTACASPDEQCCNSPGYASVCRKNETCCNAHFGETKCCTNEEQCCNYGNYGESAQCCGFSQHCDKDVGCVSDTCSVKASVTVTGEVLHSAVVNSTDACCDLCADKANCKAAVLQVLKPSQSERDAFLANLVKHVTYTSRRQFLATSSTPANILCMLMASDTMVANVGTSVLTVQREK